jgi:cell division protein FtsQ
MSGKIRIEVNQRIPVLHVMDNKGADYYIDNLGTIIPSIPTYVAYRPIVTGEVDHWFAKNFLYKLGDYLYYNSFWHAAIQQINVLPRWDLQLVPRVGNHIVYMGRMDHYEEKLNRLKEFYEKGLNRVGWNKYSGISLEFNNQIICTKRADEMAAPTAPVAPAPAPADSVHLKH